MIQVKEVFGTDAENICRRFNVTQGENERVIALTDGSTGGVGLTRFENGAVRIRLFMTDGTPQHDELLKRSMMFDACRMEGYDVWIEQDGDYSLYGFTKTENGWHVRAEKIVFPHECK